MAKLLSGPEWVYTDGWLCATNCIVTFKPMCGHVELRLTDDRKIKHDCEGGYRGARRLVDLITANLGNHSSAVINLDDLAKIVATEFGCEPNDNQKG